MTLKPARTRIELIDVLRGIALIAMTVYHFTWDLEFFGWLLPGNITQIGWVTFARAIASSFLFLVGISLVLGHGKKLRWPRFLKRFAQVAAAAALISLATYFYLESGFIFFGILHAIALYSLIGLVFLRFHGSLAAITGLAVLAIGLSLRFEFFDPPYWWWLGLSANPPNSNDYVPLFPWLSPVLFGISAAKLIPEQKWERLSAISLPSWIQRPSVFIGQHSLIYYLVHQPLMIGAIWATTQLVGAPDKTPAFISICTNQCVENRDAEFCTVYCQCVADAMVEQKLMTPFLNAEINVTSHSGVKKIIRDCSGDLGN